MLARRAIRVRRYLPAKLSAPDIAGMPCLPVNTTRTRMRHLYDKRGGTAATRPSSRPAPSARWHLPP